MRVRPLIVASLLAFCSVPLPAFADFVKPLKPDPMRCSGQEQTSGTPIELKISYTENGNEIGSDLSWTIGQSEGFVGNTEPLPLVSEGNLYIQQVIDELEYNLTLNSGALEQLSKDLDNKELEGKVYKFSGNLHFEGQVFDLNCEAKFAN